MDDYISMYRSLFNSSAESYAYTPRKREREIVTFLSRCEDKANSSGNITYYGIVVA